MITVEELYTLYQDLGSAKAVSEYLAMNGKWMPVRTIQHKLKQAYPDYQKKKKATVYDDRPVAGGTLTAPDKRRGTLQGKRFVFTAAQNNTYIHEDFFASLLNFCTLRDAELVVSTFTYNQHGFQNGTKADDTLWYDPRLEEYIRNESVVVAGGLVFSGELDVLPTAVDPLSGFENYTQEASGIIPHTKMQMKSIPRMKGESPRFLYTTGAVTQRNYIQRKAGQKAEFHHVFGALYVEIDEDGEWFARQLIASEDGQFYDLTDKFTPDGITEDNHVATITWGDIHVEKLDIGVQRGAFDYNYESSMLATLRPTAQFVHDLTDFSARNHHNIKDKFYLAKMFAEDTGNVQHDLMLSAQFIQELSKAAPVYVVESNHDQALRRWLTEADISQDPENAEYYHWACWQIHKAINEQSDMNIYEHSLRKWLSYDDSIQFLREDDSLMVAGIEHGMHGHRGPNGARGNPRGFRTIGRKVNIGHMHSAGIFDGVYVAGVSAELDLGYNKGPSSWSHSHIVTYQNGKRAIITMRGSKWKAN